MSKKQIMNKMSATKNIKAMRLNHLFFTPLEKLLNTPDHELYSKKEYARLLVNYLNNIMSMKKSMGIKL
jgi:hypothetical protein